MIFYIGRMGFWPLLVGLLIAAATGRALLIGAASAGGDGIRRDEEPLFYWLGIMAGTAASAFLIWWALVS